MAGCPLRLRLAGGPAARRGPPPRTSLSGTPEDAADSALGEDGEVCTHPEAGRTVGGGTNGTPGAAANTGTFG